MSKLKFLLAILTVSIFYRLDGQNYVNVSVDTLQSYTTYWFCADLQEIHIYAQSGCSYFYWVYGITGYSDNPIIITKANAGEWSYTGCDGFYADYFHINFGSGVAPVDPWPDHVAYMCPMDYPYVLKAEEHPEPDHLFSWDGQPFDTTSLIVCHTVGETHSVVIKDACGNEVSASCSINTYPNKSPYLDPVSYICEGESVTLDPGEFESYRWSNGATTRTITVSLAGTYSVETVNEYGCDGFAQTQVMLLPPQNADGISPLFTADTLSDHNMVVWSKDNPDAERVVVYRETTTNNYQRVGDADYLSGSFTDGVSSAERTYRYKLSIVDRCGNEGPLGQSYQPISAQYMGPGQTSWWIQWTPLKIAEHVNCADYEVYSIDSRESFLMTRVDEDIFFDDFFQYYYMNLPNGMEDSLLCVKAIIREDFGGGVSLSNIVLNLESADGVTESTDPTPSVSPNPAEGRFTVCGTGHAVIYNAMGQKADELDVRGQADVELPAGIYLVRLGGRTLKAVVR